MKSALTLSASARLQAKEIANFFFLKTNSRNGFRFQPGGKRGIFQLLDAQGGFVESRRPRHRRQLVQRRAISLRSLTPAMDYTAAVAVKMPRRARQLLKWQGERPGNAVFVEINFQNFAAASIEPPPKP